MTSLNTLLAVHGRALPVYHLSHIDLDGYGAQFITRQLFNQVAFANSDYGNGILDQFRGLVARYRAHGGPALFLITDVNLTPAQAEAVVELLTPFEDAVALMLLDHHSTGQKTAERFPWYRLDAQRCATRLTFETFAPRLLDSASAQSVFLQAVAEHVDAYDLWQETNPRFACGNLLSDQILDLRDIIPESHADLARDYRHALISNLMRARLRGVTLRELERSVYQFKEDFLTDRRAQLPAGLLADAEQSLTHKYYHLVAAQTLADWETQVDTVNVDGLRGALVFGWPKGIFQTVSNLLLDKRPEYDFFVNVVTTGYLSFRSRAKDLTPMVARYFGGGGHPRACGANLNRPVPHRAAARALIEGRVQADRARN